ncbi:MAG TPA: glycosyl hydrolase [Gaiellaceae bacterium]|nr:glycosyl hydrolase [Gaiellaceae bacterium]
MLKRIALVSVVLATAVTVTPAASASPQMMKGIFDETQTLYGNPDTTFPMLALLGTKAVRVNLYWGGRWGVSKGVPTRLDPDEPGKFDWSLYDRLLLYANQYGIKVVLSVYGTPGWANGGKALNVPPRNAKDLENFVYLAATRYSGRYVNNDGVTLPMVRHWIAWNEPNNPVFLRQQYRRVGKRWVIQSARDYAKICNAVVTGVGRADITGFREGQNVACGATAPRGNNAAGSARPSVSPLAFLRAMKAAGAKGFDAYAHHPYYGHRKETPLSKPPARTAVTLGNFQVLVNEVTRLWGQKRIWITEYGYQTNPPDRAFGVSNALQARYLTQAYAYARRHPRIDMMLWFMLRDDTRLAGWQSGLLNARGARKPAFAAFQRVR